LLRDGLGDLASPVADVDDGEAGERVHELVTALRPDPHTLRAIDDQLLVGEPGVILRLVRPEVTDRFRWCGHVGASGRVDCGYRRPACTGRQARRRGAISAPRAR